MALSEDVVSAEIILQILILISAGVFFTIRNKISLRRERIRNEQRFINWDIETQTSRPLAPRKNEALLARVVTQWSRNRVAGSYTLSSQELAELEALRDTTTSSRTQTSINLPLPTTLIATETTPLLPLTRRDIERRKWCVTRAWNKLVFRISLNAKHFARQFFKQLRLLQCKTHAWTMLQPDKIPLLGLEAPNNGVTLAIGGMLLINIITLLIGLPITNEFLPALAKRAAMLKAANTPVLYLLAMKTQPLQYLAGCSYEHVNIFHRRLGELSLSLAMIHSAGHIIPPVIDFVDRMPYDIVDTPQEAFGKVLKYFYGYILHTQSSPITGLAALIGCIAILVTSSPRFRRKSYRLFLRLHGPLQIVTLVFSFIHSAFARPFIALAVSLYLIDRLVFRYCLRQEKLIARTDILEDDEVVHLNIGRAPSPSKFIERLKTSVAKCVAGSWAPGCHVLLTVRSLEAPYNTESHPVYLLGVRDNIDDFFARTDMLLLVKNYGLWSNALIQKCQMDSVLTGIEVEGPYGSGYTQRILRDREICILIASPMGMGPILTTAQSLVDWENGYNPVTNQETPRHQEVLLIMVYRQRRQLTWFQSETQRLDGSGIDCLAVGPSEIYSDPAEQLRVVMEMYIRRKDLKMDKRIGVLCCGPRAMQRTVRETTSAFRAEGYLCKVDTLSFSV